MRNTTISKRVVRYTVAALAILGAASGFAVGTEGTSPVDDDSVVYVISRPGQGIVKGG